MNDEFRPQNNDRDVPRARYIRPEQYREPRSNPLKSFFVVAGFLILMFSCCCNFVLVSALGGDPDAKNSNKVSFTQRVYSQGSANKRLLLIRIEGTIMNSQGGLFGGPSVDIVKQFNDQLEFAAASENNIKGIILRINSPGGGVTESDQMYDKLEKLKAKTKLPVIVSMGGMCASGGYYISAGADEIFAEPTTITGSIGVILGGLNYSEFLRRYGVHDVSITSGPNKALLNSQGPVEKEHLKILQSTVDDMYKRFVGIVAKGRKLSLKTIKAKNIADGRIFTSSQAKKLGLVDDIAYLDEVIDHARKKIGQADAEVVELSSIKNLIDVLAGRAEVKPGIDPAKILNPTPRMLYLWKP